MKFTCYVRWRKSNYELFRIGGGVIGMEEFSFLPELVPVLLYFSRVVTIIHFI